MISHSQIGFLPRNRTADHILLVKTLIDSYKNSRKKLFVCFVDLWKAFDTVFRAGLLYKLTKMNLSTKFIKIIEAMYQDVVACVKTKKGLTPSFSIEVGTRQ